MITQTLKDFISSYNAEGDLFAVTLAVVFPSHSGFGEWQLGETETQKWADLNDFSDQFDGILDEYKESSDGATRQSAGFTVFEHAGKGTRLAISIEALPN